MKKVKNFFIGIIRWVKDTPQLHPLILISGIFLVIFVVTLIPRVVNSISAWIASFEPSAIEVNYQETYDLINTPEGTYVIYFGTESCGNCTDFKEQVVKPYLRNKNEIKIYYFDIDKAYDEEDITKNQVELLYHEAIDTASNYTARIKFESIYTPAIIFVYESEIYRYYEGNFRGGYAEFLNFIDPDRKYSPSQAQVDLPPLFKDEAYQ